MKQINSIMALDTLDILLCSGEGRFSRIIQRANKLAVYAGVDASISHVALVLKTSSLVWVFESTTMNKYCGKSGVQINVFDEWLENYKGSVYVRKIHCERPEGIDNWMAEQVGRPYENGLGGLLELLTVYTPHQWLNKTKFGRWLRGKLRTPEVHCSEIDAECLQKFGLMMAIRVNKLPPPLWFGSMLDKLMVRGVEIGFPIKLK